MTKQAPVILVASSLDAYSDGIVQAAAKFAECSGAAIHLYHVIEQSRVLSFSLRVLEGPASSELEAETERKRCEEALHKQAQRCVPRETSVASVDVSKGAGPTYLKILEKANSIGATLIVMGPHTGTDTTARFLGTTAERILRTAEIPCLVLSGALGNVPAKVGVAVDLSSSTKTVLASAGFWAKVCAGGKPEPVLEALYVGWWVEKEDNPEMEDKTIRPAIEQAFAEVQDENPGLRAVSLKPHVVWDNAPIQPILNWIDKNSFDLLVLGTHGLSGLRRALLGSTASTVTRLASCPILLVPPALQD